METTGVRVRNVEPSTPHWSRWPKRRARDLASSAFETPRLRPSRLSGRCDSLARCLARPQSWLGPVTVCREFWSGTPSPYPPRRSQRREASMRGKFLSMSRLHPLFAANARFSLQTAQLRTRRRCNCQMLIIDARQATPRYHCPSELRRGPRQV